MHHAMSIATLCKCTIAHAPYQYAWQHPKHVMHHEQASRLTKLDRCTNEFFLEQGYRYPITPLNVSLITLLLERNCGCFKDPLPLISWSNLDNWILDLSYHWWVVASPWLLLAWYSWNWNQLFLCFVLPRLVILVPDGISSANPS